MRSYFKYLNVAAVLCVATCVHAEMSSQKHHATDESLVSRVLNADSPNFNHNFNQLDSLSINRQNQDKVYKETLAAKIEIQEKQNVIDKLNTVASSTVKKFSQTGVASWYGRQFHGRKTASGEIFNMNALTAAHPSLPMNCYVRVTNERNGKSVVVKINDRGPFHGNRVLDLSYAAAKKIGMTESGTAKVRIERVSGPNS